MTARRARAAPLLLALLLGAPALARAQTSCGGGSGDRAPPPASAGARQWPAPLDRVVALQAREISLRDALDRLAAAARVRLSYSADLLPLDRSVCVVRAAVRVGDALVDLLSGTAVEPVVAGADQVVLAPAARAGARLVPDDSGAAAARAAAGVAMARTVGVLDRVVVTGSAAGGPQRPLPVALGVLDGRQLAMRNVTSLSDLLDGGVPGVWVWAQSPSALLARYGSIRGASSFGVSYPKVYIDGIEVANPLLVTQLDPEAVERVEVIRGPQGAALYGADAISGVVNVVTRHGGAQDGAARVKLRSTGGVSESDYASPMVTQEHALTLRTGSGLRTASLGIWGASVGEFVPNAYARRLTANGGLRVVGARSSVSATARLFAARAGVATSPIIAALSGPSGSTRSGSSGGADWPQPHPRQQHQEQQQQQPQQPQQPHYPQQLPYEPATTLMDDGPQSVLQYTVGTTLSVARGERWTHAVVVGVDGYRLSGVPDDDRLVPFASDPALEPARSGADRASIRASSIAQLLSRDDATASLTLAAELSQLRERAATDSHGGYYVMPDHGGAGGYESPRDPRRGVGPLSEVEWLGNSGVLAQASASLRQRVYFTGGLRLENNEASAGGVEALPMLGVATVRGRGPLTVKLRGAYGKGIRPPRTATRLGTQPGSHLAVRGSQLEPERQSGVEAGVDLFVGRSLSFQVTRFDQLASGLIQRVAQAPVDQPRGSPSARRLNFELQNVGEVTNRGWELQASLAGRGLMAPLSLTATLSLVDSRVRALAAGYGGDLRPGDRMLEVPARTAGLTALWSGSRWSGSITAARAADWVNYDRVALAAIYASPTFRPYDLTGERLRAFWLHYDGVTRMRATASHTLRRGLSLQLTSENLLGQQHDEPDNVTVLPGRTVTGGVKVEF